MYMILQNFDTVIFSYLNGFVGQSIFFDMMVLFIASFIPFFVVLSYGAFLLFTFYRRHRHIPSRVSQFDREGIAIVAVLLSSSLSHLIASGIQEMVARPRPYLALDTAHLFTVGTWSFPSGHAALFFAFAASAYCFNRRVGAVLYLSATFIGLARVIAGVHYPTDVVGGAVLGIAIGVITARFVAVVAQREIRRIRRSVLTSTRHQAHH
jgi:undecaprenyl-diphosphatase